MLTDTVIINIIHIIQTVLEINQNTVNETL